MRAKSHAQPEPDGHDSTPSTRRSMRFRRLGVLLAALLCAAAGARAEGPHVEEDPLWRLPFAPDGVGVGWNEGVVYGFDWPVKLRGRVGATIDLDGGWVGGSPDSKWDGLVRRARFDTRGKLYHWLGPAYRFQFALEEDEVFLNDFFLRWPIAYSWIDSVRIGYFDPPLSLAALESSASAALMEIPAPAAAFAPGFRAGVEAAGTRAAPDITWQTAISAAGQQGQNQGQVSKSGFRWTGRIVWRPTREETNEETNEESLLHLGLGLEYTFSGKAGFAFRARPESFLADFLVDTGEIEGGAGFTVFEVAWRRGPLSVLSEVFGAFVGTGGKEVTLYGGYAEVRYSLTGETRPYHRGSAGFGRMEPTRPFSWKQRHWGALELTGRASWVDLDEDPVQGGKMLTTNLGLVWTLNDHVRLHAEWVYADAKRRGNGTEVYIVQTRLELRF
jgi:phosphate-selective porin OprO/OprP